jgi:hypothetical protein
MRRAPVRRAAVRLRGPVARGAAPGSGGLRARPLRPGGPGPTLVLFLKEPRPGRVKTRLARETGTVAAAWWFRHQALGLVRDLGRDPRWRTVLAVTPDAEGLASRVWPAGLPRWPQGRGDLGARMGRALRAGPPGPVIVVGADIPGLRPAHIARAFRLLGRADAVIGPAGDGGYWLIGLRRGGRAAPAGLFGGVRWSGPHALADTMASLRPLRVARADRLDDVDTAGDLLRLRGRGALR